MGYTFDSFMPSFLCKISKRYLHLKLKLNSMKVDDHSRKSEIDFYLKAAGGNGKMIFLA